MTTAFLKAKKFREILSDLIGQNSKVKNRALFLEQDWSRTTFKTNNYNHKAVNNDEKQGRQYYLVVCLR